MIDLGTFHFLRPAWLGLLPVAAGVAWWLWRGRADQGRFRGVIAPHLLDPLLVGGERGKKRLRPLHVLLLFWTVAIVALAGPSWRREPTPFAEDQAALFIALEVTPGMLGDDLLPSRLERACHKIHDLVEGRPGARTGLIAYAGSAHLVMPLTADGRILETLARELTPELMPEKGDAPERAIALANSRLGDTPGSILLVTDSVPPETIPSLETMRREGGAPVHILGVGREPQGSALTDPPPLDRDALERVAQAGGGSLTVITPDLSDVERISRRIERTLRSATNEGERWRDEGYLCVPVAALLALLWFRRGWRLEELG